MNAPRIPRLSLPWLAAAIAVLAALVALPVLAQTGVLTGNELGFNEISGNIGLPGGDPRILIARVIRVLLGFLGIIAVGIVMYGGYMWMTAAGNAERIETAKKVLINGLIGLLIIFTAFAIVSFILGRFIDATGGGERCTIPNSRTCSNVGCTGIQDCVDDGDGDNLGIWGGCEIDLNTCPDGGSSFFFVRTYKPPERAKRDMSSPNFGTVPRNTIAKVQFNTDVNPATLPIDSDGDGNLDNPDAIKLLIGDANCDGQVDISDKTAIENRAAAMDTPAAVLQAGECGGLDVNGDGQVTSEDAVSWDAQPANGVVAGAWELVNERVIKFVPTAICPTKPTDRCLDEFVTYTIYVQDGNGGVRSADPNNLTLTCSTLSGGTPCQSTFATNDYIDNESPKVKIIKPGSSTENITTDFTASATDQGGIAEICLSGKELVCSLDSLKSCQTDNDCDLATEGSCVDNGTNALLTNGPRECVSPSVSDSIFSYSASTSWDATGLQGKAYALKAEAEDLDSNPLSEAKQCVKVLPAHCSNGVQDATETGIDCGGDPDALGADYCGACAGQQCDAGVAASVCDNNRDLACGSGSGCDTNTNICVRLPVIVEVSPNDGAPGNFITIWGGGFGNTPGTVTFLGTPDPGDDVSATIPANCDPSLSWTDTEVIIEIPAGAVDGPVKLTTDAGFFDRTDIPPPASDPLPDFDVNAISRPGLCSINPATACYKKEIIFKGANIGTTTGHALFGNIPGSILSWGTPPEQVIVEVPNLALTTVKARLEGANNEDTNGNGVLDDGEDANGNGVLDTALSNPKRFLSKSCAASPRIDKIDPDNGPVGQTITITGANFGRTRGKVIFDESGVPVEADIVTAAQCDAGFDWSDKQIIVKVPSGVTTLVGHDVHVERADMEVSNTKLFTLNTNPLAPSLYCLKPNNGPEGLLIKLFGDEFHESRSGGLARFYPSGTCVGEPQRVCLTDNDCAVDDICRVSTDVSGQSSWSNQKIEANVPVGATTGPVKVLRAANLLLNGNFESLADETNLVGWSPSNISSVYSNLIDPRPGLGPRAFAPGGAGMVVQDVTIGESIEGRKATVTFWARGAGNLINTVRLLEFGQSVGQAYGTFNFTSNTLSDNWTKYTGTAVINGAGGATDLRFVMNFGSAIEIDGVILTFNDEPSISSNPVTFNVGSCLDTPGTCDVASICCGDGSCRVGADVSVCPVPPPLRLSSYRWRFTAGNPAPQVVEREDCALTTQSPSPWINSSDACVNAQVTANFTTKLSPPPADSGWLVVKKCLDARDNCTQNIDPHDPTVFSVDDETDGLTWTPSVSFEAGIWYEVTINGVESDNGVAMTEFYSWKFQASDTCEVTALSCQPSRYTLSEQFNTTCVDGKSCVDLSAFGQSSNCNLININGDVNWNVSDVNVSLQNPNGFNADTNKAQADSETPPPTPDVVSVTSISNQGAKAGECKLGVKFSPFEVIDYWPSCDNACVNSGVGVRLSKAPEGIPGWPIIPIIIDTRLVSIDKCLDGFSCQSLISVPIVAVMARPESLPSPAWWDLYIQPSSQLDALSTYRVRIKGGVGGLVGNDGKTLSNTNIVDNGVAYYQWIFGVGDSACEVDSVSVSPQEALARTIGATQPYFVQPRSAPDECDARGQLLNPIDFNYSWASSSEGVATVTEGNLDNDVNNYVDPNQTATAVGTDSSCGLAPDYKCSTDISATTNSQTDSGKLTLQCGFSAAGRCELPRVLAGTSGDTNCDTFINDADTSTLVSRLDYLGNEPDAVPFIFKVVDDATGAEVTSVSEGDEIRFIGGIANIGQMKVTNVGLVNWYIDDINHSVPLFASGGSNSDILSGEVKNAPDVNVQTVSPWTVTSGPHTIEVEISSIQGTTATDIETGDALANNIAKVVIQADGTINFVKANALAGELYENSECSGMDVNADGRVNYVDNFSLNQIIAGQQNICSNNSEVNCVTNADCAGVNNCGGSAGVTGVCRPTGFCSNDEAVPCLDDAGQLENKLCNFSPNTAGCCGARPWVESVEYATNPGTQNNAGDDMVCPNTAIKVGFSTLMRGQGLADGVELQQAKTGGDCSALALDTDSPWWKRIWKFVKNFFTGTAKATHTPDGKVWCGVDGSVGVRNETTITGTQKTSVIIYPTEPLKSNVCSNDSNISCTADQDCGVGNTCEAAEYRVFARGENSVTGQLGVASIYGVQMQPDYIKDLNPPGISSELCAIDRIGIDISPSLPQAMSSRSEFRPYDIFQCVGDTCVCDEAANASRQGCRVTTAGEESEDQDTRAVQEATGNQHKYTATAYDAAGQILSANFEWQDTVDLDPLNLIKLEGDGASADQLVTIIEAPASGKRSFTSFKVKATLGAVEETSAEKTVPIVVDLCKNPWSNPLQNGPANDKDNFYTTYCRDNGDQPLPDFNKLVLGVPIPNPLDIRGEYILKAPDFCDYNGSTSCFVDRDCRHTVCPANEPCSEDVNNDGFVDKADPEYWQYVKSVDVNGDDVVNGSDLNQIRDQVNAGSTGNCDVQNPDAIGVRVVSNPRHLTPEQWYSEQPFPKGSPQSTTVDGYPAVQDGRTIYIGAGNAVNEGSAWNLYTNIYILSYNQGASAETLNIFDQLVGNLSFNINLLHAGQCRNEQSGDLLTPEKGCLFDTNCGAGFICNNEKSAIVRDVKRVTDILDLQATLADYLYGSQCPLVTPGAPGDADCNGTIDAYDILLAQWYQINPDQLPTYCQAADQDGDGDIDTTDIGAIKRTVERECRRDPTRFTNFPALSAGSYVQSTSTSRWPSWTDNLGQELGVTMPIDPLNYFAACEANSILFPDHNQSTCWDEIAKTYASHHGETEQNLPVMTRVSPPPDVPWGSQGTCTGNGSVSCWNDFDCAPDSGNCTGISSPSQVYTYSAYGRCANDDVKACLVDSAPYGGCSIGACQSQGQDYAACGFFEYKYAPTPRALNQNTNGNRLCILTSEDVKDVLPPPPDGALPQGGDPIITPDPDIYDLTIVLTGSGQGRVEISKDGALLDSCEKGTMDTTCIFSYDGGSSLTLREFFIPDQAVSSKWTRACADAIGDTCSLTLNSPITAGVEFKKTVTLSVTLAAGSTGSGSVRADWFGGSLTWPNLPQDYEFEKGTTVHLTSIPDQCSALSAPWTVCQSASGNECTVTLNQNIAKTVTVQFDGKDVTASLSYTDGSDTKTFVEEQNVDLNWRSSGATGVALTTNLARNIGSQDASCDGSNGTFSFPAVFGENEYILRATRSGRQAQAVLPVVVLKKTEIISASANPSTIAPGEFATLSWTVDGERPLTWDLTCNKTDCYIDGGLSSGSIDRTAGTPQTFSLSVSPVETTTYTLGLSGEGGQDSKSLTVIVAPLVAINSFSATPTDILEGDNVTFSWSVNNATKIEILRNNTVVNTVYIGSQSNNSGSRQLTVDSGGYYTLKATGYNSSDTQISSPPILITTHPRPTVTLSASKTLIDEGEGIRLSWLTTNAASISSLTSNFDPQPTGSLSSLNGSSDLIYPTRDTTYTITVVGTWNNATQQSTVRVTVIPKPTLTLAASGSGQGKVTIKKGLTTLKVCSTNPDPTANEFAFPCSVDVLKTDSLALTASNVFGDASGFGGWFGEPSCSGSTNLICGPFTLSGDTTITANFLRAYTLVMSKPNNILGRVWSDSASSSGNSFNCPSGTCQTYSIDLIEGESINLYKTPDVGNNWLRWNGCDRVNGSGTCQIGPIFSTKNINAYFNYAPIVTISAHSPVTSGTSFQIFSTASDSENNTPFSYNWTQLSGPQSTLFSIDRSTVDVVPPTLSRSQVTLTGWARYHDGASNKYIEINNYQHSGNLLLVIVGQQSNSVWPTSVKWAYDPNTANDQTLSILATADCSGQPGISATNYTDTRIYYLENPTGTRGTIKISRSSSNDPDGITVLSYGNFNSFGATAYKCDYVNDRSHSVFITPQDSDSLIVGAVSRNRVAKDNCEVNMSDERGVYCSRGGCSSNASLTNNAYLGTCIGYNLDPVTNVTEITEFTDDFSSPGDGSSGQRDDTYAVGKIPSAKHSTNSIDFGFTTPLAEFNSYGTASMYSSIVAVELIPPPIVSEIMTFKLEVTDRVGGQDGNTGSSTVDVVLTP